MNNGGQPVVEPAGMADAGGVFWFVPATRSIREQDMNGFSSLWRLVLIAVVVVGIGACHGQGCERVATEEGKEGNLEFAYKPADDSTQFDRPVAVGSSKDISVEPLDGRALDQVIGAYTTDETVIDAAVVDAAADEVHLTALAPGSVELVVEVEGGGEVYEDRVDMRAEDVWFADLAHRCTTAVEAAYVADERASLVLERRSEAEEKLAGFSNSRHDALNSCQVEIFPGEDQELPYCDEDGLHFPSFPAYGLIDVFLVEEVAPGDDGYVDIGMHVIPADELQFAHRPRHELQVDRSETVTLDPFWQDTYGGAEWDVCTNMHLEIDIVTPAVCRGPMGRRSFSIEPEDKNEIDLRGEAPGICEFDVYYRGDSYDAGPWPVEVPVDE